MRGKRKLRARAADCHLSSLNMTWTIELEVCVVDCGLPSPSVSLPPAPRPPSLDFQHRELICQLLRAGLPRGCGGGGTELCPRFQPLLEALRAQQRLL